MTANTSPPPQENTILQAHLECRRGDTVVSQALLSTSWVAPMSPPLPCDVRVLGPLCSACPGFLPSDLTQWCVFKCHSCAGDAHTSSSPDRPELQTRKPSHPDRTSHPQPETPSGEAPHPPAQSCPLPAPRPRISISVGSASSWASYLHARLRHWLQASPLWNLPTGPLAALSAPPTPVHCPCGKRSQPVEPCPELASCCASSVTQLSPPTLF